VDALV